MDPVLNAMAPTVGAEAFVVVEGKNGGVAFAPLSRQASVAVPDDPRSVSVRKRDYPTRVRKATHERLELGATDENGQIRCQSPDCIVLGGRPLAPKEGTPQHNPPLVETHNQRGWDVDQPTRNNLYNETATELHCIQCQRAEGGATRSTYRQDTG